MNVDFNTATQGQLNYAAYLVRLWQDTPDGPWRASAQAVHSGETRRFASLKDLFTFLEANTNPTQPPAVGAQ